MTNPPSPLLKSGSVLCCHITPKIGNCEHIFTVRFVEPITCLNATIKTLERFHEVFGISSDLKEDLRVADMIHNIFLTMYAKQQGPEDEPPDMLWD